VESSRLGLIVDVVNITAKAEAHQNAAVVLFYFFLSAYYDEISCIPETVPTLVRQARHGAYHGRKNALVSLHGLLLQCACTHGRAVNDGTVPVLVGLHSSPSHRR
jgi:hypothetical protein